MNDDQIHVQRLAASAATDLILVAVLTALFVNVFAILGALWGLS